MGCINIPIPPIPTLPFPFSIPPIEIPLPGTPELELCCRIPAFQLPPIPIPISAQLLLSPVVSLAIDSAIAVVTEYVNKIPLKCPLE